MCCILLDCIEVHCIGVQVLNLRLRMTRSRGGEPYRFFTVRSELEMRWRGIHRKLSEVDDIVVETEDAGKYAIKPIICSKYEAGECDSPLRKYG